MLDSVMITVLTPTYNREKLLNRLAKSLFDQTNYNFEWLIIDDGSSDNTEKLINSLKQDSPFIIRYIFKENGGKHTALNKGFKNAEGDWVLIVDSDDWLDLNCIETLSGHLKVLAKDIYAISFNRITETGRVLGGLQNENLTTYIERYENNITGDRADLLKKSVVESFVFPVFPGEKFMAESPFFIWFGKNFKTKFLNYNGYVCEYQSDGLSKKNVLNRHESPKSTLYVYSTQYNSFKTVTLKIRAAINWWRFRIAKQVNPDELSRRPPVVYSSIGFVLFSLDLMNYGFLVVMGRRK